MLKISPIKINCIKRKKTLTNKVLSMAKNNNTKLVFKHVLPVPLVMYTVSPDGQNNLKKNLAKEITKKVINRDSTSPITDRTEKNLKALEKAGVSEGDRRKYIKSDGYMDRDGKKICKKNDVTNFKGASEDNVITENKDLVLESDADIDKNTMLTDLEYQADMDWIDSIDEKMCPECEVIYNSVSDVTPEGLMSSIFDEIPEGFETDDNLLDMLKSMTKNLLGE